MTNSTQKRQSIVTVATAIGSGSAHETKKITLWPFIQQWFGVSMLS